MTQNETSFFRDARPFEEIRRSILPELIDLLTATIEAGLGFAGSLQLVADRFEGPLGQELRLTLQEQTMGLHDAVDPLVIGRGPAIRLCRAAWRAAAGVQRVSRVGEGNDQLRPAPNMWSMST